MLRYIDGNNNAYEIAGSQLEYKPITPAESSSGTYSGGEPKSAPLSDTRRTAIEDLVQRIVEDVASHEPQRPKGTGMIVLGTSHICFDSPLKAELEQMLKAALNDA